MADIEIAVEAPQWRDEDEAAVVTAIEAALAHLDLSDAQTEISVLLGDDAAARALNARWRGQDKPTNVLSFPAAQMVPGDRPAPFLGDIMIAHQTVAREAVAQKKRFDAHLQHLAVHGLLHLMGFDHICDQDAVQMERLEKDILAQLGITDPYLLPDQ